MSKSRDIKKRNKRIALAKRNGWMPGDPILATITSEPTIVSGPTSKDGGTVTATIVEAPQETVIEQADREHPEEMAAARASLGKEDVPVATISGGRGTCPVCGKREKVKKDSTMGKHGECAGNGQAAL